MTNEQMTNELAPLTPAEIAETERLVTQILDWGLVRIPWVEVLRAFGFVPRLLADWLRLKAENQRLTVSQLTSLTDSAVALLIANARLVGARAVLETIRRWAQTEYDENPNPAAVLLAQGIRNFAISLAADEKRLAEILLAEERKP